MLHFEGERTFSQPPAQLWLKLRDVAFLAECVPGGMPKPGATRDRAQCTVTPGLSFARGTLDVTMEAIESVESESLKFSLKSKGIGSSSEVETSLHFLPHDQGTTVRWSADVKNLGGLLKMVPTGLIRGAAGKVIEDTWLAVTQKLQS